MRWALWAGKESAYKALKRLEPELVFAPREFEVQPASAAVRAGDTAAWQVTHRGRTLALELRMDDRCLHAMAHDRDTPAANILAGTGPAGADASLAVRLAAIEALAATLGLEPETLRISGRPPVAWSRDRPLDVVLSLSHHGGFVAYAAVPAAAGAWSGPR